MHTHRKRMRIPKCWNFRTNLLNCALWFTAINYEKKKKIIPLSSFPSHSQFWFRFYSFTQRIAAWFLKGNNSLFHSDHSALSTRKCIKFMGWVDWLPLPTHSRAIIYQNSCVHPFPGPPFVEYHLPTGQMHKFFLNIWDVLLFRSIFSLLKKKSSIFFIIYSKFNQRWCWKHQSYTDTCREKNWNTKRLGSNNKSHVLYWCRKKEETFSLFFLSLSFSS